MKKHVKSLERSRIGNKNHRFVFSSIEENGWLWYGMVPRSLITIRVEEEKEMYTL